MDRRDSLKKLGLLGLGAVLPAGTGAFTLSKERRTARDCFLSPQTTEGPFYFDPGFLRQDIRTDSESGDFHDGLPLSLTISVVNSDCEPIPGILVDIWHCDTDGLYSGYVQPEGNTTGQNFMRGTQVTDAQGRVQFITSYPGWYPGRATHIHFKARLDAFSYVTSQFAFDEAINQAVYETPLYSERGQNTTSNASDGVFGGVDIEQLMAVCEANTDTGGYDGSFTIGIDAQTSVREPEPAPDQFFLAPNHPNPFNPQTTLRFHLPVAERAEIRVYDALGREVAVPLRGSRLEAGWHQVDFDGSSLASGYYIARFTAGSHAQARQMLLVK